MRSFLFAVLFVISFFSVSTSCSTSKDSNSITYIKHGSSFGMCRGYCYNENTFTKTEKIAFSKAYGRTNPEEFPDKSDTTGLDVKIWDELVNSFVVDSFFKLDETIGCPDCADRGSEWLEIKTKKKVYKVTFDYGKELSGMNDLLKLVREEKQ